MVHGGSGEIQIAVDSSGALKLLDGGPSGKVNSAQRSTDTFKL